MTDYWVMVQRMRIDIAKLACAISGGDLEQVVKQVPNFNGTWGIVRGIVIDSYSPVSGAYPTW